MRVLFSSIGGFSATLTMSPLARALAAAGHQVAFAVGPDLSQRMERAGFSVFAAGMSGAERERELAERFGSSRTELGAGGSHEEQLAKLFVRRFVSVAAPRLADDVYKIVDAWHPDLVVCGAEEFGGPLAAAAAGLPRVTHGLSARWDPEFQQAIEVAAARLWRGWGIEMRRGAEGIYGNLFLDIVPPSLQPTATEPFRAVQPLRPVPAQPVGDEALPSWVDALPTLPTVHVTLGTVFTSLDVFSKVLAGLSRELLNVIVTVGFRNDPSALGPQPEHVHVERYLPYSLLLPRCDLVVAHGGTGTVLASLSHGLPLLLLPQGADQFGNARRCSTRGVARCLLNEDLSAEAVRDEVRKLLEQPSFRQAAQEVAEEIAGMPAPEEVVGVLERLEGSVTTRS